MEFQDRLLKCSDCHTEFVFTAGEQLFFSEKQFKNDPKRCKLCKAKRAGLGRVTTGATAAAVMALPLSRTETRTDCSACGIETTVPFRPTQGRPVLCRSCFGMKRVPSAVTAVVAMDSVSEQVAAATAALHAMGADVGADFGGAQTAPEHTLAMIEASPAEIFTDGASTPAAELLAATVALDS